MTLKITLTCLILTTLCIWIFFVMTYLMGGNIGGSFAIEKTYNFTMITYPIIGLIGLFLVWKKGHIQNLGIEYLTYCIVLLCFFSYGKYKDYKSAHFDLEESHEWIDHKIDDLLEVHLPKSFTSEEKHIHTHFSGLDSIKESFDYTFSYGSYTISGNSVVPVRLFMTIYAPIPEPFTIFKDGALAIDSSSFMLDQETTKRFKLPGQIGIANNIPNTNINRVEDARARQMIRYEDSNRRLAVSLIFEKGRIDLDAGIKLLLKILPTIKIVSNLDKRVLEIKRLSDHKNEQE